MALLELLCCYNYCLALQQLTVLQLCAIAYNNLSRSYLTIMQPQTSNQTSLATYILHHISSLLSACPHTRSASTQQLLSLHSTAPKLTSFVQAISTAFVHRQALSIPIDTLRLCLCYLRDLITKTPQMPSILTSLSVICDNAPGELEQLACRVLVRYLLRAGNAREQQLYVGTLVRLLAEAAERQDFAQSLVRRATHVLGDARWARHTGNGSSIRARNTIYSILRTHARFVPVGIPQPLWISLIIALCTYSKLPLPLPFLYDYLLSPLPPLQVYLLCCLHQHTHNNLNTSIKQLGELIIMLENRLGDKRFVASLREEVGGDEPEEVVVGLMVGCIGRVLEDYRARHLKQMDYQQCHVLQICVSHDYAIYRLIGLLELAFLNDHPTGLLCHLSALIGHYHRTLTRSQLVDLLQQLFKQVRDRQLMQAYFLMMEGLDQHAMGSDWMVNLLRRQVKKCLHEGQQMQMSGVAVRILRKLGLQEDNRSFMQHYGSMFEYHYRDLFEEPGSDDQVPISATELADGLQLAPYFTHSTQLLTHLLKEIHRRLTQDCSDTSDSGSIRQELLQGMRAATQDAVTLQPMMEFVLACLQVGQVGWQLWCDYAGVLAVGCRGWDNRLATVLKRGFGSGNQAVELSCIEIVLALLLRINASIYQTNRLTMHNHEHSLALQQLCVLSLPHALSLLLQQQPSPAPCQVLLQLSIHSALAPALAQSLACLCAQMPHSTTCSYDFDVAWDVLVIMHGLSNQYTEKKLIDRRVQGLMLGAVEGMMGDLAMGDLAMGDMQGAGQGERRWSQLGYVRRVLHGESRVGAVVDGCLRGRVGVSE